VLRGTPKAKVAVAETHNTEARHSQSVLGTPSKER